MKLYTHLQFEKQQTKQFMAEIMAQILIYVFFFYIWWILFFFFNNTFSSIDVEFISSHQTGINNCNDSKLLINSKYLLNSAEALKC